MLTHQKDCLDKNLVKYQAHQMEELLDMATDNARKTIEARELVDQWDP